VNAYVSYVERNTLIGSCIYVQCIDLKLDIKADIYIAWRRFVV